MPAARSIPLFVTPLYQARLRSPAGLAQTCLDIAAQDKAGRRWSKAHGYKGYTSYASLDDLLQRASVFAELEQGIRSHVKAFARTLQFEGPPPPTLDSLWVNAMGRGGVHAPHIHPHSVISGTFYVAAPPGSGALRFEDPRAGLMMAAPPRKRNARMENRTFVDIMPKAGMLLLWESWQRHGVEPNKTTAPRISISFNYRLERAMPPEAKKLQDKG